MVASTETAQSIIPAASASASTWDRVLTQVLAEADAAGMIDWAVSVDATIARAHQHATNTTRPDQDTGGRGESQAVSYTHLRAHET